MRRSGKAHYNHITGIVLSLSLAAAALPMAAARQEMSLSRMKSVAETQHEIVMLLIRKKEFSKAAVEANKIFALAWPESEEPVLLGELLGISSQFLHNSHPEISVQFLDANMDRFKSVNSRIAILKEKGYLLKKMNEDDKALDCFREAQRLQKPSPF